MSSIALPGYTIRLVGFGRKGSQSFMETMETCSFHSVPHFQECLPGVTVNGDINLGELLEKIPM
jgi:hypothetical protein